MQREFEMQRLCSAYADSLLPACGTSPALSKIRRETASSSRAARAGARFADRLVCAIDRVREIDAQLPAVLPLKLPPPLKNGI